MHRRILISLSIAAAACMAEPEPIQECVADFDHDFTPGARWGPCDDGVCTDGTLCYRDDWENELCGLYQCAPHPWCAETLAGVDADQITAHPCMQACLSDYDCPLGAVCGVYYGCVWPDQQCTSDADCLPSETCLDYPDGGSVCH